MVLNKVMVWRCVLLAAPGTLIQSALAAEEQFWYEISIMHGAQPYEVYGTSKYAADEFNDMIAEGEFVRLDDLTFRTKSDHGDPRYRSWSEWDPVKKPSIYIKADYVIAVHPLKGDPRENREAD